MPVSGAFLLILRMMQMPGSNFRGLPYAMDPSPAEQVCLQRNNKKREEAY